MTNKKLNIGLVGYGFMGRTHSNAFGQVNQFFDLRYQPVLKAVCARDRAKAAAFAGQWGYDSIETDWRKLVERPDIDLIDIASPNDTHAEIAIAAAQAGKMVLCEKPLGRNAAEAEGMVRSGGGRGRAQHGLVQLPARPGRHAGQATDRTKAGWAASSTIAPSFCRIGPSPRICRRAARACGAGRQRGRQRRHGRSAGALHRHGHVAQRRHRSRHRHDRNIHQGAPAHAHRQSGAGGHRRCQRISGALSKRLARRRLKPRVTRAATRRFTRSRSTASTPPSPGTCTICIACNISITRDESRLRGWRSIHITDGDHPYMKHWWVPGLQIGYEHTFIHQVADFLAGLATAKPPHPHSATP